MKRIALLAPLLLASLPARADLLTMKDGNIIEVKVTGTVRKADKKDYWVVEDDKGKKREILATDVHSIQKCMTSWEARAENKKWYDKEKPLRKETWDDQLKFAKACRTKNMDDEAEAHFKKAYELRLASTPDDEKVRALFAQWLEKECELFDEALDEWRKIYKGKAARAEKTADARIGLAKWCVEQELYTEAKGEYEQALAIEPANSAAKQALAKLQVAMEVPVDPGFYRMVKPALQGAAKFLRLQQAKDGSIGADVTEYSVYGLKAMTALSAAALVAAWEFESIEKPEKAAEIPKEISRAVEFLISGQGGPAIPGAIDNWGPIFTIQLFVRLMKKKLFEPKKEALKKGIEDAVAALKATQMTDGGWMYYTQIQTCSSFQTAGAVIALCTAKNAGFTVDDGCIGRGADALAKLKYAEGSYDYYYLPPQSGVESSHSAIGACARSPLCEFALAAAGKGSESSRLQAMNNFCTFQTVLEKIKGQKGTHVGKGMTAPYYFLFGHYWTTRCFRTLDRGPMRARLAWMRNILVRYQEADGAFTDWPDTKGYRVYGAALVALALREIATTEKDPAIAEK